MTKRDERVKQMISASEVAEIWNERASKEGKEAHYTRFSVYTQRNKLRGIDTHLGRLFEKEHAETIDLPKYRARPDTAKRNRDRKSQPQE